MTLEALVRTVDATERTECTEARASLCMSKSSLLFSVDSSSCQSFSSKRALLVLMQNLQTKKVIRHTTATPPMTPPAIGPAAGPELVGNDVGWAPDFAVHMVTAHELHPPAISEQISSEAHVGHGGGVGGHVAHRRKRCGALNSTSTKKGSESNPRRTLLSLLTEPTETMKVHLCCDSARCIKSNREIRLPEACCHPRGSTASRHESPSVDQRSGLGKRTGRMWNGRVSGPARVVAELCFGMS